jgi:hypothetical protein
MKLVAEAGDSSRTQRNGNIRRWKPLPSNGSEDVAGDTGVFNSEMLIVVTLCIKGSNIFGHQSKTRL